MLTSPQEAEVFYLCFHHIDTMKVREDLQLLVLALGEEAGKTAVRIYVCVWYIVCGGSVPAPIAYASMTR